MPAPKGNQYAKGNPNSGRPVTYTKEMIEQEAVALDEWSSRPDALFIQQFTTSRNNHVGRLYEWKDQNKVFSEAFYRAKDRIAQNVRLAHINKEYPDRLAMRDLSAHDQSLKIEERAEKKYDADLKKAEAEAQAKTLAELSKMSQSGELKQK